MAKRAAKKSAAKRELISPRGDKRYIRRDAAGRIKESDDVGRSLSQDRRRKAKKAAKPGQGDRGPTPRLRPGRKRVPSVSPTLDLFGDDALPRGFRYQEDFLNSGEEQSLLQHIKPLPFREFEFHGFTGKRRIVSFGWRYDFGGGLTRPRICGFLSGLRYGQKFRGYRRSAAASPLPIRAGRAIGWHKDRSVFGDVVGISLYRRLPAAASRRPLAAP
jgi:hypothetical protein